jgi:hypothetical protein
MACQAFDLCVFEETKCQMHPKVTTMPTSYVRANTYSPSHEMPSAVLVDPAGHSTHCPGVKLKRLAAGAGRYLPRGTLSPAATTIGSWISTTPAFVMRRPDWGVSGTWLGSHWLQLKVFTRRVLPLGVSLLKVVSVRPKPGAQSEVVSGEGVSRAAGQRDGRRAKR